MAGHCGHPGIEHEILDAARSQPRLWGACHGARDQVAQYLFDRGADLNWIPPWEHLTPLDAAAREHADELVLWLRDRGAKSAS